MGNCCCVSVDDRKNESQLLKDEVQIASLKQYPDGSLVETKVQPMKEVTDDGKLYESYRSARGNKNAATGAEPE